jgi:uncharacterized linocin/CFP29 family protein
MSDHLLRKHAPFSAKVWTAIEEDVKPRLIAQLAARKLVDFEGPKGWEHSATDLGRSDSIPGLSDGLTAHKRAVLPLVEVRANFALSRRALDNIERGARDVDLANLDDAARRMALSENRTVFHGYADAGIVGLAEASSHATIALDANVEKSPGTVASAVDVMRQAGVTGPYGLAISPDVYTEIVETTEQGGYPLFDHLREILGGPVVWAPGVECGVVLSLRGGDFVLETGQDIELGYASHDSDVVNLYLEESLNFRVLEPDAAVALRIDGKKARSK